MFISVSDIRQKGIVAESEGRYVAAVILLEQCLRADPLDSYGWLVLADAYREMGHCTDCARALDMALEHGPEPEQWMIYVRYGMLATIQGQFLVAEEFFEKAAQFEGAQRHRWPVTLRAANLLQMEQFEGAERLLRLALTIEDGGDDLDEVFHNLGLALLGQRKYQEARNALEKAKGLNPESKPTQLALKSLDGWAEAIPLAEQLSMRT